MRRPKRLRQKAYDYESDGLRAPVHPVWLDGRVPKNFWCDPVNVRGYLEWLGRELGFNAIDDWYQLLPKHFAENHGKGCLNRCGTPQAALELAYPEVDWLEWRFPKVSEGFWNEPSNLRRYLQWLGARIGCRRNEDWYQVTLHDVRDHDDGASSIRVRWEFSRALITAYPEFDWSPWRFEWPPFGWWKSSCHRREYLMDLGTKLGFTLPDDWYRLRRQDFQDRAGLQLMEYVYRDSPIAALRDVFPNCEWYEWLFPRVPPYFWDDRENRQRYVAWLGQQLGIRDEAGWLAVTRHDFSAHHGAGLLHRWPHRVILQEAMPHLRWPDQPVA